MFSARALLSAIALVIAFATPRPAEATWVSGCSTPAALGQYVSMYSDKVDNCFQASSPGASSFTQTTVVHSGTKAISFSPANWNYLQFYRTGLTQSFNALEAWVNGGSTGGQDLVLQIDVGSAGRAVAVHLSTVLGRALPANQWVNISVPLPWPTTSGTLTIAFAPATGSVKGTVYVDDVRLVSATIGSCSGASGTSCTDGNPCNGPELCDGAGLCLAAVPPATDDASSCTVDRCDPATGVTHTPAAQGLSCALNTGCTSLGSCDGAGACVATPKPNDLRVYADGLEGCFADRSWAVRSLAETTEVHEGYRGILLEPDSWNALSFNATVADAGYRGIEFWVNGGAGSGQVAWATVSDPSGQLTRENLGLWLLSGTWEKVTLLFPRASAAGSVTFQITAETSADQPAFYIDDVRLLGDRSPPVISVISPVDGSFSASTDVPVDVLWQDAPSAWSAGLDLGSARVTLDGIDVSGQLTVDSAGVRGTLIGLGQGQHQIAFAIADKLANAATASLNVTVDSLAPSIIWANPPLVTSAAEVPLGFTVDDSTSGLTFTSIAAGANELIVTGVLACQPAGTNGILHTLCSGTYPLGEGTWHLQAFARDIAGNPGTAVTDVVVDRSPPLIVLDPDIDGIVTGTQVVTLSGRLTDATSVTVTVNGETVPVAQSAFTTHVAMTPGSNAITIVATDAVGLSNSRTITVVYKVGMPTVTSLYLDTQEVPCVDPATAGSVTIASTMNPTLSAAYSDESSAVNGPGVLVEVDGILRPCSAAAASLVCPIEIPAGAHVVRLRIPDLSGSNVRTCSFNVFMDAKPVPADPTSAIAGAEVQVPAGMGIQVALSPATPPAPPPVGQALAGPVVDLSSDIPKQDDGKTVRVTLPYSLTGLAAASDADVRVYRYEGGSWALEPRTMWTIDTVAKTVTYTTSHFSLRAAMVSDRPVIVSAPILAVVDNKDPGNTGKRMRLFDATSLTWTGTDVQLGAETPELEKLTLQEITGAPSTNPGLETFYIRETRPLSQGGFIVQTRERWSDTAPCVLHDFDRLTAMSPAGKKVWEIRVHRPSDVVEVPTSDICPGPTKVLQESIRSFAFSADQKRIYVLGDTSYQNGQSAGDGVYVVDLQGLTPEVPYLATDNAAPIAIGQSGTIVTSAYWGYDTIFVAGSGPSGWVSNLAAPLDLSSATAHQLETRLAGWGDQAIALVAGGPYGMYEYTSLQDILDSQAEKPCSAWIPGYSIGSDGVQLDYPNLTSATEPTSAKDVYWYTNLQSWTYECAPELYGFFEIPFLTPDVSRGLRGRLLAQQALWAREPRRLDLVANMLEAGQILVLRRDGTSLTRAGTIPLGTEHGPLEPVSATISDPSFWMGVGSDAKLWVRTTTVEMQRLEPLRPDLSGPLPSDPAQVYFNREPSVSGYYADPYRVTILGPPAFVPKLYSIALRSSSASAEPWSVVSVGFGPPGAVGRTALDMTGDGRDPIGVDPRTLELSRFQPGGTGIASIPYGSVAGPQQPAINNVLYSSTNTGFGLDDASGKVGQYIVTSNAFTHETPGQANPYDGAESLVTRYMQWGSNGTAWGTPGTLYGSQDGFGFAAGGEMPKSAAAFVGSTASLATHYVLPAPVLTRLSDAGAVLGRPGIVHDVRPKPGELPSLGPLKIALRQYSAVSGVPQEIDLPTLQLAVDPRPLGTPNRSTVALRVFVADTQPSTTVVSTAGADGRPVTLIRPQPIRDPHDPSKADPAYAFFVVADPDSTDSSAFGGLTIVEDCQDDLSLMDPGTVTPYAIKAPVKIVPCPDHLPRGLCIDQMPLQQETRVQPIYVDVVVCGVASHLWGDTVDKARQQSLASQPLKALVGAVRCSADDECANGFCVDGYCCDGRCDQACQGCSQDRTGMESGTCSRAEAGRLCHGGPFACAAPPACDGANEWCAAADDTDGDAACASEDNCPAAFNPDQRDIDHDGLGDLCDEDIDGDGAGNSEEVALGLDPYSADTNGDGIPDGVTAEELGWAQTIADEPAVMPVVPDQEYAGAVAGEPGVNGGAATYRMPIEVAPGIRGMQPTLALAYRSRTGNGVAGVGWSLGGTSVIQRCPRTVAQDGVAAPVNLGTTDRLCMDGVRLVLVDGVYGTSGSVYRAEIDQLERITLTNGDMSSLAARFIVEHKSGRRSIYAVEPGAAMPINWLVTAESDPQGNCIGFDYVAYRSNAAVLSKIRYTGTLSSSAPACITSEKARVVVFDYEDRTDNRTLYIAGTPQRLVARLKAVTVVLGELSPVAAIVRRYALNYNQSQATGRSLLSSVVVCRPAIEDVLAEAAPTCDGYVQLPATVFTYQEQMTDFESYQIPVPGGWSGQRMRVYLGGDYDGDGQRDQIQDQLQFDWGGQPVTRRLLMSSGATKELLVSGASPEPWYGDFGDSLTPPGEQAGYTTSHDDDVDGDGKADLVGMTDCYDAGNARICTASIASYQDSSKDFSSLATNMRLFNPGATTRLRLKDYNGDGRPDLIVSNEGNESLYLRMPRCSDALKGANGTPSTDCDTQEIGSAGYQLAFNQSNVAVLPQGRSYDGDAADYPTRLVDLNGDGYLDQIFEWNGWGPRPDAFVPRVVFYKGPDGFEMDHTLQDLGVGKAPDSGGPFYMHPGRRFLDVNGDGLVDVYDPGLAAGDTGASLWINQGGPIRLADEDGNGGLFVRVPIAGDRPVGVRYRLLHSAFPMDIDNDGMDELMVPDTQTKEWCYGLTLPRRDGPEIFCGQQFDTLGPDYSWLDRSLYSWAAYKFHEQSDGSYSAEAIPTSLRAPINVPLTPRDFFGNGVQSVGYRLAKGYGATNQGLREVLGFYTKTGDEQLGEYVTRRKASGDGFPPAPDLLRSVVNGLGAEARWQHQPISRKESTSACGEYSSAKPFYVANHDVAHEASRQAGNVFFTSSMWAVSQFDVSNGLLPGEKNCGADTSSFNTTCYRYEDAVLNTEGRGLLGFTRIISEERLPPAEGEPCPAAGALSVNNLRTVTTVRTDFPFIGRVAETAVWLAADDANAKPIRLTSVTWQKDQRKKGNGDAIASYLVWPSVTTEQSWALEKRGSSDTAISTKATILEYSDGDKVYGNPTKTCTVTRDAIRGTVSSSAFQYADSDAADWWIDKQTSRTDTDDVLSNDWSGGQCPSPSAAARVRVVSFGWNAGRLPRYQASGVQGEDTFRCTDYDEYDAFGNLKSQSECGAANSTADEVNGCSCPVDPVTQLPTRRRTTNTYSPDGYFRETTKLHVQESTQAPGLESTVVTDPGTGKPVSQQTGHLGPVTAIAYDAFGRVVQRATTFATAANAHANLGQPAYERLHKCVAEDNCGAAVYTRTVIQAGAPTRREWIDCLGRVVREDHESFSTAWIETRTQFNARAAKVGQLEPRFDTGGETGGAPEYWTKFAEIDALGRVGSKTVERSAGLYGPSPNLVTTYKYDGLKTTVSVAQGTGLQTTVRHCATPSEASEDLSMSRTYDSRGWLSETVDAAGSKTSFGYDASGHLVSITDANANVTTFHYDAYGRKDYADDPDRGHSDFYYNGFGEVRLQRDARGIEIAFDRDMAGRVVRRWVKSPNDVNRMLDAEWHYDFAGMPDVVAWEAGPSSKGFRRDYLYNAARQVIKTTTKLRGTAALSAGLTAVVRTAFDGNYGRPKAMGYPSGESVEIRYDAHGFLVTEMRPPSVGTDTYRTVLEMSERGEISKQTLGNGVQDVFNRDPSTGAMASQSTDGPGSYLIRGMSYTYDRFGNVATQSKSFALGGTTGEATEAFLYDDLQRLCSADRSWQHVTGSSTESVSYRYDALGNITRKSDYGGANDYIYGTSLRTEANAGPHAVRSVDTASGTANYAYDNNGNATDAAGRAVTYDAFDRPTKIVQGGTSTSFEYDPDGQRYLQVTNDRTVYYIGKVHEYSVEPGKVETRDFIGESTLVATTNGVRDVRYLHKDRLGSVDAVTNDLGTESLMDAHGYDAFGKPRGREWLSSGDQLYLTGREQASTLRGFTGHEHLDDHYLIHMNGRVYDYRLGRFLSVDPVISNGANSQSLNPYSYVGNNPLSGKDPTGYFNVTVGGSSVDIYVFTGASPILRFGLATFFPGLWGQHEVGAQTTRDSVANSLPDVGAPGGGGGPVPWGPLVSASIGQNAGVAPTVGQAAPMSDAANPEVWPSLNPASTITHGKHPAQDPACTLTFTNAAGLDVPVHYNWGHPGVDIGNPTSTWDFGAPVVAMRSGTVTSVSPEPGANNANQVVVTHADGSHAIYRHTLPAVPANTVVMAGQWIGNSDRSGYTNGPHIHFELWVNGAPVDPAGILGAAQRITTPVQPSWINGDQQGGQPWLR